MHVRTHSDIKGTEAHCIRFVHTAVARTSQGPARRQRAHQLARTLRPYLCVNELPRGTLRFAVQPDLPASHVSPQLFNSPVSGFAFSGLVPTIGARRSDLQNRPDDASHIDRLRKTRVFVVSLIV